MAVNNVTFNGTEYINSNVLSNAIIGVYGSLEKDDKNDIQKVSNTLWGYNFNDNDKVSAQFKTLDVYHISRGYNPAGHSFSVFFTKISDSKIRIILLGQHKNSNSYNIDWWDQNVTNKVKTIDCSGSIIQL